MTSTHETVLRRRLATQRLVGRKLATPDEVVRLLAAVQSQEWAHGFWSLGMRTRGSTYTDVQEAFNDGRFVRTHMLRTTWHFVAADDIRWMLRATSPRVLAKFGSYFRRFGLEEHSQHKMGELLVALLQGKNYLTRKEIGHELQRRGVEVKEERLAYIVMSAELHGLICSGPMRGAQQHTYAVLDERVPTGLRYEGDAARAELAFRFFSGHGPASLTDFTRWSSMTVKEAQAAVEATRDRLDSTEVDGQKLWFDPTAPKPRAGPLTAYLLPLYDEVLLTYPQLNFPKAPGHPHRPGMDLFVGSIVVGQQNVGTWRRTLTAKALVIETDLAPGLDERTKKAIKDAVNLLRHFLGHSAQ